MVAILAVLLAVVLPLAQLVHRSNPAYLRLGVIWRWALFGLILGAAFRFLCLPIRSWADQGGLLAQFGYRLLSWVVGGVVLIVVAGVVFLIVGLTVMQEQRED